MKYSPLQEHLSKVPDDKNEITLKFSEIEKILGCRLPRSAFEYVEWWANQDYGSQAPAWLNAGFCVDHIDLKRSFVTFIRGAKQTRVKKASSRNSGQVSRTNLEPAHASFLVSLGFNVTGRWAIKSDRLVLEGELPTDPGVYAFSIDGYINYIGIASRCLKSRLKLYINPGKSQATNIRINPLIKECINSGKSVEILTICPGVVTWNDIDLDVAPGLESALIRRLQPPWNKSGI